MKYLRKPNDPTVHIATELLIARGDMIECDKNGNPLIASIEEPEPAPEASEPEPPAAPAPAAPAPKRTAKQQAVDALPDDITIGGV